MLLFLLYIVNAISSGDEPEKEKVTVKIPTKDVRNNLPIALFTGFGHPCDDKKTKVLLDLFKKNTKVKVKCFGDGLAFGNLLKRAKILCKKLSDDPDF